MSDSYIEHMVQHKQSALAAFGRYVLVFLCVIAGILFFVSANLLVLVAAVAFGVGAYFETLYTDIEYEYLYCDKEISVDKVLHKTRRKKVASYSLEKIEIMAPLKSYHLDDYKNRTCKERDLSSGIAGQPEVRYCFYYDGKEKIIFEPSPEMVKVMRNVSPRKIFMD